MNPLNAELYNRLLTKFNFVRIANAGEAMMAVPSVGYDGRQNYRIAQFGESYRIDCPLCRIHKDADTRQRLWISHRWGVGIPELQTGRMWGLVKCFHNNCTTDAAAREALKALVYGTQRPMASISLVTLKAATAPIVAAPGTCTPLTALEPSHKARTYLQQRGIDPDFVSDHYGVSYCRDSDRFPLAINRITIPIYMREAFVGWQARYIGDLEKWPRWCPKYYTMPTMDKSSILYNYDRAVLHPLVVVTEGVTDCWRVGDCAVAVFGKSLSHRQAELLCTPALATGRRWNVIVVLLDGEARDDAARIKQRIEGVVPVVVVTLPENTDPGGLSSNAIWDAILAASIDQNVTLP